MYIAIIIFLIALDQISKYLIASNLPLNGPGIKLFLGFNFVYAQNTGAAFSLFEGNPLILGMFSVIVASVIGFILFNNKKLHKFQKLALALIVAGAIGNGIDRLLLHYVRDFISFSVPHFNFATFNIADSCVVIGSAILIIGSFFHKENVASQALNSNSSLE